MKSKIKSLSRNEKITIIVFEKDNKIIKIIETAIQKLKPTFKLSNYSKKYGDKTLEDYWELNNSKEVNFTLIAKKDFVRLKLKGDLEFINKFLKIINKSTVFSELSPKVKAKLQRRKFKFIE